MCNQVGRWRARAQLGRSKARWRAVALLCGAIGVALLVERMPWFAP